MTDTYLRDVLHLPESVHAGDFKVELTGGFTEAATVERVREYVVTEQLRRAFREALSVVRSALRDGSSHAAYLHGSFGGASTAFKALRSSAALSDGFFHSVSVTSSSAIDISDMATFRGRAAYAYGCFLPYLFGGLALGNANISRSVFVTDGVSLTALGPFIPL